LGLAVEEGFIEVLFPPKERFQVTPPAQLPDPESDQVQLMLLCASHVEMIGIRRAGE